MSLFPFYCCDANYDKKQVGQGKHLSVLHVPITLIIGATQGRKSR